EICVLCGVTRNIIRRRIIGTRPAGIIAAATGWDVRLAGDGGQGLRRLQRAAAGRARARRVLWPRLWRGCGARHLRPGAARTARRGGEKQLLSWGIEGIRRVGGERARERG